MTDRELMQQALDALQLVTDLTNHDDELYEAIDALRARLAQPEPEPYGYLQYDIRLDAWVQNRSSNKGVAFYTTPPQREWQGLTDEDVKDIVFVERSWADAVRKVEAKLKEKNT
jgi:hypothetical protein